MLETFTITAGGTDKRLRYFPSAHNEARIRFQLSENLGSIERQSVEKIIVTMEKSDRKNLKQFGVRIGRHWVFIPTLLKPHIITLRSILWSLWKNTKVYTPPPGRVSAYVDDRIPMNFYSAIGYAHFPNLIIRCDIVERLASVAWVISRKGIFKMEGDATKLLSLAGCTVDEIVKVLSVLGYKNKLDSKGIIHFRYARPLNKKTKNSILKRNHDIKKKKYNKNSPFAALQNLIAEQ